MILRLANWAVMAIAVFYVAEGTGVIPRGAYFPSLPRLEQSASDPYAWLGAVQWGVSRLASASGSEGPALRSDWRLPEGREMTRVIGYYGS